MLTIINLQFHVLTAIPGLHSLLFLTRVFIVKINTDFNHERTIYS